MNLIANSRRRSPGGMLRRIVLAALSLTAAASMFAQDNPQHRAWNQPVEPFRIVGNVYYVGASDLAAYFIPTSEGHILIDTGLPETLPQILSNIGRLGYRAEDIRVVLNTQAHFDHIGGHAKLRRLTGAKVVLSEGDAPLAARGGLNDFAFGDSVPYEPVRADRLVRDGDSVRLGGETLTARITPGHTRGCTTWTWKVQHENETLDVAVLCSVSSPGYQLVGNEAYPTIESDFRKSFAVLERMQPDVFLASHASFFDLAGKRKRQVDTGDTGAFLNGDEWHEHLSRMKADFEKKIAAQKRERDEPTGE